MKSMKRTNILQKLNRDFRTVKRFVSDLDHRITRSRRESVLIISPVVKQQIIVDQHFHHTSTLTLTNLNYNSMFGLSLNLHCKRVTKPNQS